MEPGEAIRSYRLRRGRMSAAKRDALSGLGPVHALTWERGGTMDLDAAFGRRAPRVLEIGCGNGDAAVAYAAAHPEHDIVAVDAHVQGLAVLLREVDKRGLSNAKVAEGDAFGLLAALPTASLHAIHLFFPDPWPKARHHKRRIVRPAFLAEVERVLVPAGVVRLATDWSPYAAWVAAAAEVHPGLVVDGLAARPSWRPVTTYERRGIEAGRLITELTIARLAPS